MCAPSSRNTRMPWTRSSRPCGARWRSSPSAWTSPNGCSRRTARASGSDRANERRREEPMNAGELGVLIPIIAVGGFFAWMIALTLSKTYTAKLKAQTAPAGATGQEEVLAAIDELRREVAELAERGDFTGRLLAQAPDAGAGEKQPSRRRPA